MSKDAKFLHFTVSVICSERWLFQIGGLSEELCIDTGWMIMFDVQVGKRVADDTSQVFVHWGVCVLCQGSMKYLSSILYMQIWPGCWAHAAFIVDVGS